MLLIIFISTIAITGCSNPFQKNAIVISEKDDKQEKTTVNDESYNEILSEQQNSKTDNSDTYIQQDQDSEIIIDDGNFHSEEEVTNYFSNIENETNTLLSSGTSSNIKDKVINSFVNVIDFIFYDKEIKGVKFKSLQNETKNKILDVASRMDKSIEKKFPNYKNKIKTTSKNTYDKITDKLKQAKEYVLEKTEENIGEENYNNLQQNYENLKESVKDTGEKIKDGAKSVKDKIKSWYEEKTGK